MDRKELLDLLVGSVVRSRQITDFMEKNRIRREAKYAALRLVAGDLAGSLLDNQSDRDSFLAACGF